MKSKHINIAAVTAMLLLMFSLLISAFQIAIYGDVRYRFYEKEYEKYKVQEELLMEMDQIMAVTSHMMSYLVGKEESLSIVTDVDGMEQDFFNDQDRLHMSDVQKLFIGGLKFRNTALIICFSILIVLVLLKTDLWRVLPRAFLIGCIIFATLVGIVGGLFAMDFNKYFTIFHEIFFTNDLWMFDYETDYMIRMLPEAFFADMVFRIGKFFFGMLGIVAMFFLILYFIGCYKLKKRQNCDKLLKDKNPNITEEKQ